MVCSLLSEWCVHTSFYQRTANLVFFICATYCTLSPEYIAHPERYTLDREQKEFLKNQTFYGSEIVPATYKTALMNLYLHNIGDIYGTAPVTLGDALLTDPGYRVDYVLTNGSVLFRLNAKSPDFMRVCGCLAYKIAA